MPSLAIYALTPAGARLGAALARKLDGELFAKTGLTSDANPFDSLLPLVCDTFNRFEAHIFVCACGIAVRAVAPHLAAKDKDPAVVVVDDKGTFAVSLVSGHLGGSNALVQRLHELTGAIPVITTATDNAGMPSIDLLARQAGLRIADIGQVKHVSGALLAGITVPRHDPAGILDQWADYFPAAEELPLHGPALWVDYRLPPRREMLLALHPPVLWAGVGCRKGTDAKDIINLITASLACAGLAAQSLAGLASVQAKAAEPGLLAAARELDLQLICYAESQLRDVRVPNPSEHVMNTLGTPSVSEAAALLAAGGPLLLEKTASAASTVAVALDDSWRPAWD